MSTVFYGNTESANQSEKSFRANETETRERESECKHSIYIRTVSSEFLIHMYSEVRADWNKQAGMEKSATLLAYLLSKLINEQGGIFRLLHEKF